MASMMGPLSGLPSFSEAQRAGFDFGLTYSAVGRVVCVSISETLSKRTTGVPPEPPSWKVTSAAVAPAWAAVNGKV